MSPTVIRCSSRVHFDSLVLSPLPVRGVVLSRSLLRRVYLLRAPNSFHFVPVGDLVQKKANDFGELLARVAFRRKRRGGVYRSETEEDNRCRDAYFRFGDNAGYSNSFPPGQQFASRTLTRE